MSKQMKGAKEGKSTEEMLIVSREENVSLSKLLKRVAEGKVVILKNVKHEGVHPVAVGEGLRTKVNANIGTSSVMVDVQTEIEKAKTAVHYGADTVMDLSTGGDIDYVRRKILENINVPIGTVPIYQAAVEAIKKHKTIVGMDEDDILNIIEKQAADGVDFMTLHCGVTKNIVEKIDKCKRTMGIVSRGGTFITAWILHNKKENPLYSNFDYILEVAKGYDFTISLGDGLRPGSIFDATDNLQIQELLVLSELVERARRNNVQTMVEGPGHLPLDQIESNVKIAKSVCRGAPFYVLGPVVTEIAPGYDHIVGAIGGTLAGIAGADFLCYLTPSEHLALPNVEDVREGVIATKISAHIADIIKLKGKYLERDLEMVKARWNLDWEKQFTLSVDPEKARKYHSRKGGEHLETCSMCGEYCAIKILKEALQQNVYTCNL